MKTAIFIIKIKYDFSLHFKAEKPHKHWFSVTANIGNLTRFYRPWKARASAALFLPKMLRKMLLISV